MDLPEQRIVVHHRVHARHPDITEDDVRTAWRNQIKRRKREGLHPPQYAAVGFDAKGRLLETVAVYDPLNDVVLVFHAMRATWSVLNELGLT